VLAEVEAVNVAAIIVTSNAVDPGVIPTPWIETVKEWAQMQNMDIKTAGLSVAQRKHRKANLDLDLLLCCL
jgi:hypothetical protein